MRRLRFIPACLALLLASCNEQLIEQPGPVPGETGRVQFNLSADMRNEIVEVKSTSEEEIPVDSFWVEIFNSGRRRIYCEKYADAKDMVLNVNTGEYRFLAKYGDSLGVGFNHAFYMADVDFTVEPKKDNSVSAVAKLANVKAKVVFGDNILNTNFYDDCYAVLKSTNPKVKSSLKFKKGEDRAGYIPAGDLVFEVYAKLDGVWMYYPVEAKAYSPNDFVTFNVEAGTRSGDLVVTIKIDDSMDVVEEDFGIPAEEALPADSPVLTTRVFDNDGNYSLDEGTAGDSDLEVNIDAPGCFKSIVVDIQSEYLASVGVPASVDLLNLDEATSELLESVGFTWYTVQTEVGRVPVEMGVVDFEAVATAIAEGDMYHPGGNNTSSFVITVTDKNGRTGATTVNINLEAAAAATVSAEDYDVWATKIVAPKATFTKGDPKKSSLEYSNDGLNWISLGAPVSVSGNVATYNTATGLQPGAATQFRVVYKDKYFPRGEGAIVTEEAAQLGNSGFEEWNTQTHNYETKKVFGTNKEKRDWYLPWKSGETDQWWAVNSKKTLKTYTSQQYPEYKVVPTVSYSSNNAIGNYSAQLVSTFVSNMASSTDDGTGTLGGVGGLITSMDVEPEKAAGEIFIGTSGDKGVHATEGHAFPSRPESLSFQYKYDSYNSDLFHVYMYVADVDGNIIASNDFIGGTHTPDNWAAMTIPFDYTVVNKKAAKIYVCFRSSKLDDSKIEYRHTSLKIADIEKKGWIGSILTIDDLKLNY